MLTLTSDAGQTWHLTDEQASNLDMLVTLPPAVLASLVDLARAQAKLDGHRANPDGAILHAFDCRHRRLHIARGETPPVCRSKPDPAGGYSCAECGNWAKPDSERARVLDRIGSAIMVHVTDLRDGDTFRFEGEDETLVATTATYQGEGCMIVNVGDRSIHCSDNALTGERCMVEIITRGAP